MNIDEALAIIQRRGPCPHETTTRLGFGHWQRCEDCGASVTRDQITLAQEAARQFEDALTTIRLALNQNKETTA